ARNSKVRQWSLWVVIQRCVILPAPAIRARSKVPWAGISTDGETFHPGPRSRAAEAPVPSVARAPPPGAPEKFSGLIERVTTGSSAAISVYMDPPGAPEFEGQRSW